jgi:hypothetical protein
MQENINLFGSPIPRIVVDAYLCASIIGELKRVRRFTGNSRSSGRNSLRYVTYRENPAVDKRDFSSRMTYRILWQQNFRPHFCPRVSTVLQRQTQTSTLTENSRRRQPFARAQKS